MEKDSIEPPEEDEEESPIVNGNGIAITPGYDLLLLNLTWLSQLWMWASRPFRLISNERSFRPEYDALFKLFCCYVTPRRGFERGSF